MTPSTNKRHVSDLVENVLDDLEAFRNGELSREDAAERFNGAGKAASILKGVIQYHALRRERPIIPYLAYPTEKAPDALSAPEPKKLGVAA